MPSGVFAGDSSVVIPNLSPGVPALISTLSDDEVDLSEVAKQLELHPVISARLVGLANSAWSAPDRSIADLKSACVRLGMNVVKSSAIGYALAAPFNPMKCQSFDARRFWTCTLLAAEAADRLAAQYNLECSTARTGGMLRNLGLIWLVDAAPVESNAAFNAMSDQHEPNLSAALNQHVGLDHLQATKRLLSSWEIPDSLRSACEAEWESSLARVSALGSKVASSVYNGVELDFYLAGQGQPSDNLAAIHEIVSRLLPKLTMIAQSMAA